MKSFRALCAVIASAAVIGGTQRPRIAEPADAAISPFAAGSPTTSSPHRPRPGPTSPALPLSSPRGGGISRARRWGPPPPYLFLRLSRPKTLPPNTPRALPNPAPLPPRPPAVRQKRFHPRLPPPPRPHPNPPPHLPPPPPPAPHPRPSPPPRGTPPLPKNPPPNPPPLTTPRDLFFPAPPPPPPNPHTPAPITTTPPPPPPIRPPTATQTPPIFWRRISAPPNTPAPSQPQTPPAPEKLKRLPYTNPMTPSIPKFFSADITAMSTPRTPLSTRP